MTKTTTLEPLKDYYVQYNIGTARYVVNFHDGVKTHADGSKFYDIRIASNKRELNAIVADLRRSGYTERNHAATKTETRLTRLETLAEKCRKVYSEATREALDNGRVPRYALLTSEGSSESTYADNPDLTTYETTEALASAIASNLEEGWAPQQVVDLETGEDVGYEVKVVIA